MAARVLASGGDTSNSSSRRLIVLALINGRLIVELLMFFIWNNVFLIQNVIKRFRVGPKI